MWRYYAGYGLGFKNGDPPDPSQQSILHRETLARRELPVIQWELTGLYHLLPAQIDHALLLRMEAGAPIEPGTGLSLGTTHSVA